MSEPPKWYVEEMKHNGDILQVNRHRSCPPFEWFGPDPEPAPPGETCLCPGCAAQRAYGF